MHAAIPTHWLPFVAVGQARGWSPRQTVGAVAVAGGGHVLVTTVLGVGLAWFGFELSERFDHAFHWVVAGLLVALGVWLMRRGFSVRAKAAAGEGVVKEGKGTDRAALVALFLTLTLTPCEVFLPVFLSASPYGWPGVLWLSVVLAVATLGGMMTLAWLTARGVRKARWHWMERLDQRAIGALLCLLGVATVTVGH